MACQLPVWFPADLSSWDDCDENGGCQCNDLRFNAKTVISKAVYGILADSGYLESTTGYSKQYMLQMAYDEKQNKLIMSDLHSQTDPPDDSSYDTIADLTHKKLLILTYLGFDKYNARFVEQVLMYGKHNDDGNGNAKWCYSPGTFDCLYHHADNCNTEVTDFTNVTFFLTYQAGSSSYFTSEVTYPIEYINAINMEDGKPFIDGVYKSYYFKIYTFNDIINGLPLVFGGSIPSGTWFEIDWLDSNNETVYFYGYLKFPISLSSSGPGQLTVTDVSTGDIYNYDFNVYPLYQVYENLVNDLFNELTARYALQHYHELPNSHTLDVRFNSHVAEEAHLVTWTLREDVVDSINDCEIPCERFSFDTWVALMQKKMSAKDFFCKDNLTEASRILFTTRERCKNCGK